MDVRAASAGTGPLNRQAFVGATLGCAFMPLLARAEPAPVQNSGPLTVVDGRFLLRGEPLQMLCGDMHYARVPRSYWQQRLQMARAMGLNAVCTYVFWNLHEPHPGSYDFSGRNDLAGYLRLAQSEGLHVILRPGPYVCGEWEFGGYPAWLLRDPDVRVRSLDERYMTPARRWLKRLGRELDGLYASQGGPILAVQIENEYGSFGNDRAYMMAVRDDFAAAGLTRAFTFTADGAPELADGTLPGTPAFLNSGTPKSEFAQLAAFRPDGPRMCSEYYPGSLDHWGEPFAITSAAGPAADIEWMLAQGYSFNLYMFHGGTTPGFMNGANYTPDAPYLQTTTSYDFDAPLDEGGSDTPKFHVFREIITRATGRTPPAVPPVPARIAIEEFPLTQSAALSDLFGKPVYADRPRHMESFGQAYGSIAYRTTLAGPRSGRLHVGSVADYAVVLVDGEVHGTLERRLGQRDLALEIPAGRHQLTIVVENSGRINYGRELINERKGLREPVVFDATELRGWDAFVLPMDDLRPLRFATVSLPAPAFHRGTFALDRVGDTFLDTRMLGKGALWINGWNAGRFWSIGPQYSLFVPAQWLRTGTNEVIVFDFAARSQRSLSGRTTALFAPETA